MRLTLRTLLAYLDDVLDPADKEELTKKIESSEFAEDLMHRTRDTMRRLRLSAPQVVGSGMGLDPNSVAEYLDNALPPESVGDFERICLESDMHLAEVASCHHVLTMVLGQPADIDPAAKQRMYSIPAEAAERKRLRVEAAHVPVAAGVQRLAVATPVGAGDGAHSRAVARGAEIPEYLRASGWLRYRGLILGLAALLLVGATLYLLYGLDGFWQKQTTIAQAGGDGADGVPAPNTFVPAPAPAVPGPAPETASAGNEITGPALGSGAPTAEAPRYQDSTTEAPAAPQTQPLLPSSTQEVTAAAPPVSNPTSVAPSVVGPSVVEPSVVGPEGNSPAGLPEEPPYLAVPQEIGVPAASPGGLPAADTVTEPSAATESSASTTIAASDPARVAANELAEAAGAVAGETGAEVEAPAAPAPIELGTYRGGKTVLLRYDDADSGWYRVRPRSAVVAGERLLALPEFRPNIALANGVHMDLSGGTLVSVGVGDSASAGGGGAEGVASPTIDIVYGRVVLVNTSGDEQPMGLSLGPATYEARLAQNATLAIEVERRYVPGNDPRKTPAPVVARIYVPDGGLAWRDASGETTIEKPSEWTIEDGVATEVKASTSAPAWIDQEVDTLSSERLFGAREVERTLASDRPAGVQLLELFESDMRREVKSLVARSGMHVGLFVPFIEALRDSLQRPNWTGQINSLRAAMALSPESAERIYQTLVEERGERAAADMYEMLCGYSADQVGRTPEQLKTGAVVRLIDWLDEDSLDYRVLAWHDLWEITGKQLMPNPAAAVQERVRNIRTWRARLAEGELASRLNGDP